MVLKTERSPVIVLALYFSSSLALYFSSSLAQEYPTLYVLPDVKF